MEHQNVNTALPRSLFLLMFFCPPLIMYSTTPDGNKYVAVTVALSDSLVHPGDTTFIVVRFEPAGGISLIADPPPVVLLRASSWYRTDSTLALPIDSKTGYLNAAEPLRKAVLITKTSGNVRHALAGTLRYYYCSDEEGWCTRSVVEFELPMTIVQ